MKIKFSTPKSVKIITVAAAILMLSACGGTPAPLPAPPPATPGYGAGVGACGGVAGAQPVQPPGATTAGYYATLNSANPMSTGDLAVNFFYQSVPTPGYQVANVVGSGAVKIPALTGYVQASGVIPVCVSSNNNSPGLLNPASGGIKIKMTGPLPQMPQGAIPGGPIPMGYPYGYGTNQSMGTVELRIGWSCDAWIVPQGRVIGCVDVISYGYPGGSQSYYAQ